MLQTIAGREQSASRSRGSRKQRSHCGKSRREQRFDCPALSQTLTSSFTELSNPYRNAAFTSSLMTFPDHWIWVYGCVTGAFRWSGVTVCGRSFRQRSARHCHNSRFDARLRETLHCSSAIPESDRNSVKCYRSNRYPAGSGQTAPVGVAVDNEHDLAVVTNSADSTVSLVALTPNTPTGPSGTPVGAVSTIGTSLSPSERNRRRGGSAASDVALVANNRSNNFACRFDAYQ